VGGRSWDALAERTFDAIASLIELARAPRAAPLGMAAFLGKVQWYDLLCRSKLACYQQVYTFARRQPGGTVDDVPPGVVEELLASVALSAWWTVPLHRPFEPVVLATDASTGYGFGGSVASLPLGEVRQLSRLCSRVGDRVVLDPSDGASPAPPALGRRHHLSATKSCFRDVFSIKAKRTAHINVMEVGALNMGLEWWLRDAKRHHKRAVILLDSRVAIGGAAKGRSSSGPLLHGLRRTAALILAGSLQPYFVFIGTSDNPADAPSRGCTKRARDDRLTRYVNRIERSWDRLQNSPACCGNAP